MRGGSKTTNLTNNDYLFQWWERYYPSNKPIPDDPVLTHIEFFKDGDIRYNHIWKKNDGYMHTANGVWERDTLSPNKFKIHHSLMTSDFFEIEVISVTEENILFVIPSTKDTVYMKPAQ